MGYGAGQLGWAIQLGYSNRMVGGGVGSTCDIGWQYASLSFRHALTMCRLSRR